MERFLFYSVGNTGEPHKLFILMTYECW